MPEHLRALVVILVLAGAVFAFARPLACAGAMSAQDFARRRSLWFALTLAAFLAHNFWIFMAFAAALLLFALPYERNKLALFFLVLLAVPGIEAPVPGFGLMQHFFYLDYPRLLALVILLPAYLFLRAQPDTERFGSLLPDKLLAAYLALVFALRLPHEPVTEALRGGVFYAFTDVFLPYYVASRSLKSLQHFRDALMALVVAALVVSAVAAFEFAWRWMLYVPLEQGLGVSWALGIYLPRGDYLRAQASAGHPLVLGYAIAVAIGLFLFLRSSVPSPRVWAGGLALLLAGLVAALSRGPWLGAAAIVLMFIVTGPRAAARLTKLALALVCLVPPLLVLPAGQAILDYLPFVGTIEAGNLTYRERLFEISLDVIRAHPFFGAYDFLQLRVMQELLLIQGMGFVDVVNTYLQVALKNGLVGLALFCGFFMAVAAGIFARMRGIAERSSEPYALGQALLAALLGVLIMICSVSSISLVPLIYWSLGGLGVAYARMLALAPAAAPAAAAGPAAQEQPA
jgi:O-antigen ligase